MADILPFRRPRRRPTRSRGPRNRVSWGQAWFGTRPFILAIVLATLAAVHQTPGFYEPPAFLQSKPVPIEADFERCGGWGGGVYCVIDGDTFKVAGQTFRVTGIDTAERDARCPAEAKQAEVSTVALQRWLSTDRLDEPTDRYDRTLAIVKRVNADGGEEHLADWMREHGGARRYSGGLRDGWC
jgi:micrococcal nuclease